MVQETVYLYGFPLERRRNTQHTRWFVPDGGRTSTGKESVWRLANFGRMKK